MNPKVTEPDIVLMASGSEVQHIVGAERALTAKGVSARLVSMPCWELFAAAPREYRDTVLPPRVTRRLSVEAGVTLGWQKWVGDHGRSLGIDRFGASAPGARLMKEFGFTTENVVARALEML